MFVIAGIEHQLLLFVFHLISDGREGSLLEENLGSNRLFYLYGLWDLVITEAHRPI